MSYSCIHLCNNYTSDTAPHSAAQRSTAQHSRTHNTARHSTAQNSTHSISRRGTAQHSTAQHSTAQHSTAQHRTAQHSTAQHSTAQHSTAQPSTAQPSTAQHSLRVQHSRDSQYSEDRAQQSLWSKQQHAAMSCTEPQRPQKGLCLLVIITGVSRGSSPKAHCNICQFFVQHCKHLQQQHLPRWRNWSLDWCRSQFLQAKCNQAYVHHTFGLVCLQRVKSHTVHHPMCGAGNLVHMVLCAGVPRPDGYGTHAV